MTCVRVCVCVLCSILSLFSGFRTHTATQLSNTCGAAPEQNVFCQLLSHLSNRKILFS